ncbi:hypothetical protein RJR06_005308 [Klebsiella oxytoca]|nr:hypothetical protein [Klebsiella oxytoca]ELP0884103.1 hypothetical protein [Klebsiella oxytoca]
MNNELTAAQATIEKCREITGCPDGVDLQDWVKQLAAENVGLKDCIVKHYPAVEHWNSWADAEDKIQSALDTPATDRIVAGIKADGVDSGIKTIVTMLNHQAPGVSDAINVLRVHSSELREGAK